MKRLLFLAIICSTFRLATPGSAADTSNYCIRFTTSNAHSNIWDNQGNYKLTSSLTAGRAYSVTLKVKASSNCMFGLWPTNTLSENKNRWGYSNDVQYLPGQLVDTEWKTITWKFTAEVPADRLDFVFGYLNGNIYMDDVRLVDDEVGVNMVKNGDFSSRGIEGWSTFTGYNGTQFDIVEVGNPSGAPSIVEPVVPKRWKMAKQGNPNFHIYLCFGQSNMEGAAKPDSIDFVNVPTRFKTMAAVDYPNSHRKMGEWYTAAPPLCREGCGLTPIDYFGRTLVERLPDSITVGVINVAVGGAKIELYMEEFKDPYIAEQADWFKNFCKNYDNDPLARLIEMGRKAQEVGVIKGILLHQGESNNGETAWAEKVAKVYTRICYQLGLDPDEVPLLAGETLHEKQGGGCWHHNVTALPRLKSAIPNSYIISAEGLSGNGRDPWHFSAESYRELGKRYARQMLDILKKQKSVPKNSVDNGVAKNADDNFFLLPESMLYNHNGRIYLR